MGVLVGKKAPDFTAKAAVGNKIVENFTLSSLRGHYVVLFFYPLDFTFVCPTELHAFQEKIQEFKKRNAQIVGCSVDSPHSHLAWLSMPKAKGGIHGIEYPILSDINKTISRDYDVLIAHEGISYRGLFLIDKEGIVRHQVVNDLPLGRSVDETIRILDAWINFELHGEVCPANWQVGKKTLKPTNEGVEHYFAHVNK
jgi:peroxiredoxin 2/4